METTTQSFTPQLVGQTENALRAILNHQLAGTELTYPEWVSLVLAATGGESVDRNLLVGRVGGALKVDPATAESHIQALATAGLAHAATEATGPIMVTPGGQRLVDRVRAQAAEITRRLWADLPTADLEASGRVLSTVLARAEAELIADPCTSGR